MLSNHWNCISEEMGTVGKQKDIWVSGKLPPLPQLLPVPIFIPSSYQPYWELLLFNKQLWCRYKLVPLKSLRQISFPVCLLQSPARRWWCFISASGTWGQHLLVAAMESSLHIPRDSPGSAQYCASIQKNRNMRIYMGTMQIYQFQLLKDSPCATLDALDTAQVGSPASVCIWRQRKEIFLWDGEQSSREKSDHTAKAIWSFALTRVMITSPSLAALPLCPDVHPHTRACSLWHSQQLSAG